MNRVFVRVCLLMVFSTTFALSLTAGAKPRLQKLTVKMTQRGFEFSFTCGMHMMRGKLIVQ